MSLRRRYNMLTICGVFLLFLDRYAKEYALSHRTETWYIIRPYLGWEYFANPGIAFSIPVPNTLVLITTPIVLLGLLWFVFKKRTLPVPFISIFGTYLVFFGAVSNFVDRFEYKTTVDYIRVFTSIINIADIMIVVGIILILKGFQNQTHDE
jgi:lipoprotein signal peptidase